MIVLGIESSCDETACAVIETQQGTDLVKVLSSVTATSAGLHQLTGGIIPEQAARKQIEVIIPVVDLALKDAQIAPKEIDAIAVTYGPGLIGSLLVGVETAKTLSFVWDKPIVPVNHLVAHIYSAWIEYSSKYSTSPILPGGKAKLRGASKGHRAKGKAPSFPALALVVSGGHTDMVVLGGHGNIKWLGGTRDDAAGEAFDKAARLLGFDYPGGPILAQTADEFIAKNPNKKLALFPRPMLANSNLDFSFSGLKTAVLHKVASVAGSEIGFADYEKIAKNKAVQSQAPLLAAETQEAIVDVLVAKTLRAAKEHEVKSLIVGGGVSANKRLRERFVGAIASEGLAFSFHVPEPKYSTDNAEMIAAFASLNFNPMPWEEIAANPELNITG